ncbi:MAG: 4-(cytidine 5'-diphospho)-2-C-methyl-D-erythritol kinase [Pseudomonadota bacterium]
MRVLAPAKVNLTLHVVGQRPDGYHLLDSLVAFADIGDRIEVRAAPGLSLAVDGPFRQGVPTDGSNLVLKAATAMGPGPGAMLTLDKRLPAAAGVGGGSSDAAATLRALSSLWDKPLPAPEEVLRLGADVPVCLRARATRMAGIGENLSDGPPLPPIWAVLVNPGVDVPTPAVFARLADKSQEPMPAVLPKWPTAKAFAEWLARQRNDLQPPAMALQPVIGEVIDALDSQNGCVLARMSGSGATCFGLFEERDQANSAAQRLRLSQGDWWVAATALT